jgi:hypothetical protein
MAYSLFLSWPPPHTLPSDLGSRFPLLGAEPRFHRFGRTIWKQFDWPASFQVDQNGPVGLPFFPGPVVDVQNAYARERGNANRSHAEKKR